MNGGAYRDMAVESIRKCDVIEVRADYSLGKAADNRQVPCWRDPRTITRPGCNNLWCVQLVRTRQEKATAGRIIWMRGDVDLTVGVVDAYGFSSRRIGGKSG